MSGWMFDLLVLLTVLLCGGMSLAGLVSDWLSRHRHAWFRGDNVEIGFSMRLPRDERDWLGEFTEGTH